MRLIHDGNGGVTAFDDVARAQPLPEGPAKPLFKIKLKGKAAFDRSTLPAVRNGNGYRAGALHELGADQCRFIADDHNRVMCGKHGFPWCEDHKKIVYRGHWK